MMKRATELEWLKWFYQNCDFGPAHGSVMEQWKHEFMQETGKALPKGYAVDE